MTDGDGQAAMLRGRLHTLLGSSCGAADFTPLLDDAKKSIGADHSVTLLIEAARQQKLSYGRPVGASAAEWARLRERAERSLAAEDKTLLAIRSHQIRFLRLRSGPGDLDEVIGLRRAEVATRAGQFPDHDNLLGIARSDLAVALIDRARTAGRCAGQPGDPAADLAEASDLIDHEVERRSRLYSQESSLVQATRLVRCEVLVGQAERAGEDERQRCAEEALALTGPLVGYYWAGGGRSFGLLKSLLLRAESLALIRGAADGARVARLACGISGLVSDIIDRGWPLFVLARIQLPLGRQDALRTAAKALRARDPIFPANSCRILEVREFIGSLS